MVLNLDIFNDLSFSLATLLKDAMPEMSILGVTAQRSSISSHAADVLLQKTLHLLQTGRDYERAVLQIEILANFIRVRRDEGASR